MKRPAEAVAGDSLGWLLETAHHLPPAELATAVAEALARVGALSSCLFLADHEQVSLKPFGPAAGESSSFRVDGTVAGRTFALEMTCTVATDCGIRLWVPVVDGTARLGVLAVDLTAEDARDGQTRRYVEHVASLAAQLLMTKSEYSDAMELARRNRKMSLAAELQRGTLPPITLATSRVMVAGIVEPAYEVAGDTFDYALNPNVLHVAIIDSVGHDIESSVVSHLVQGSLRNSRRNGRDLPEAYLRANEALTRVFREFTFATAAFGHLDLSSGRFSWVSAGTRPRSLSAAAKWSTKRTPFRCGRSACRARSLRSMSSPSAPGTCCSYTPTASLKVDGVAPSGSVWSGSRTCCPVTCWPTCRPPRRCAGWCVPSSNTPPTNSTTTSR